MKLSLIVAHDKNRLIGNKNDLPWRLPPDLKNFKNLTLGKPIIMGRNTFKSLPKVLPGRKNIVITSKFDGLEFDVFEDLSKDVYYFSSITKALIFCETWLKAEEAFIIGGSSLYSSVLEDYKVDTIYRTLIDAEFEGDVYFPEFNEDDYSLVENHPQQFEQITFYFQKLSSKDLI